MSMWKISLKNFQNIFIGAIPSPYHQRFPSMKHRYSWSDRLPISPHVHIHRFTADEKDFSLSLEMTGEEDGSPHIVCHTVRQSLVSSHQPPVPTLSPSHTLPRLH